MGKRIISIFFAAVLLLSVVAALPTTAGAADTDAAGTGDVISYFEVIDLDEPVPGQKPDYTVSVPAGAHYTVGHVEWREKDESADLDPIFINDTFKSNKRYTVRICLNADSGYEFADTETATGSINGKTARASSYGNSSVAWVERTYTCSFKITSVSVTLDEPFPGQTPDRTASVPAGANYYEDQVLYPEWYHYDNGDWHDELGYNEPFESGNTYLVRIYLYPDPGYEFGDDGENVTAAINGKPTTVSGRGQRIYVEHTFTCTANFLSGTVTSFLDSSDKVTVSLDSVISDGFFKLVDKAVFEGNSAAYRFGGLEKNVKYRLTVSKKNHVTRQYEFKILFTDSKTLDVKICPIGDADNNGRVNAADAKAAFQHGNEQKLITDDYKFKCADVASPKDRINSADAKAIFRHANEQQSLWTE